MGDLHFLRFRRASTVRPHSSVDRRVAKRNGRHGSIHSDVVSLLAPSIISALTTHVTRFAHPLGQWLVDQLTGWDCVLCEESVEASIYSVIRRRWAESVGERLGIATQNLVAPNGLPESASRMLYEAAMHLSSTGTA